MTWQAMTPSCAKLSIETVSHPIHRHDVLEVRIHGLNFSASILHVAIDRTITDVEHVLMNAVEQLCSRKDTPRPGQQQAQGLPSAAAAVLGTIMLVQRLA